MKQINLYIKISIIVAILLISFSIFFRFVLYPYLKENKERKMRQLCVVVAEQQATNLLKTKAKMDKTGIYGDMAKEEGMYLKPDFESYYETCLRRCGLDR